MSRELWKFEALDTLFFKESRPIESVGNNQLNSVFPPPAKTLIGAIRTAVGEHMQVNWQQFANSACAETVHQTLGTPSSLGPLHFVGPNLYQKNQRLYPVPLTVLAGKDHASTRLVPGAITECDLGKVQLPVKQNMQLAGAKPLEQAYLQEAEFVQAMQGNTFTASKVLHANNLFTTEPRLGIARDPARNTVLEGMLYQTQHIRPLPGADLAVGIELGGLQASQLGLAAKGLLRLGAEGRLAAWSRSQATTLPAIPAPQSPKGILLCLLSHAQFEHGWVPDGFSKTETDNQTVWQGNIAGVPLTILSAVIGKPIKEGGWDMVAKQPKSLTSMVPVGSCYFCTSSQPLPDVQKALHGQQIGQETAWGRGLIAAGYW
jgi:CRISPR-associated protein Cmr3